MISIAEFKRKKDAGIMIPNGEGEWEDEIEVDYWIDTKTGKEYKVCSETKIVSVEEEKVTTSSTIEIQNEEYGEEEILDNEIDNEQWLWCLHCQRFFQVKDLRRDNLGRTEGCAFTDCNGAGLGIDIDRWDSWAKQNDVKHWPKSVKELYKGKFCPLYADDNKNEFMVHHRECEIDNRENVLNISFGKFLRATVYMFCKLVNRRINKFINKFIRYTKVS